jgi:uncharacterized membrane protein
MDVEQEDRTLRIIMIISFIGMIDSIYLSYLHHLVDGGGGCPTQNLPGLDCGVVLASSQSKLLGLPVAWFGVLGFVGLFGLSFDRYLNMDLERTYYNTILLPVTGLIGTVFGIYLTYVEAVILEEYCPFCLIAFALTLGATFFALKTYGPELVSQLKMQAEPVDEEPVDEEPINEEPVEMEKSNTTNVTNIYNISDTVINRSKIGNTEDEKE